ncbi:MAG: SBBP repeat-containing protein [Chitinophagales bacterium]|nr:SBBP repeat-containing protein [Chitinophagales bacterium]
MKILCHLMLLLALTVAGTANGQLQLAWANIYNGTGDFTDKIKCAVRDPAGNLYLGGYTSTTGNHDFLVVKLNPAGDTLWTRTYDGLEKGEDEVNDIAVDASGNVYVTGYADNDIAKDDYVTIKYNANGAVQWIAVYNSPYSQNDEAVSIAVDASGNVFVTGESEVNDAGTNEDYITIKYNATGAVQWIKRYNGPGNSVDRAVKIVLDNAGNPVVTGRAYNGASDDWVTLKYLSADGSLLWTNVLDYAENDRPGDMAIDAAGNIYITGRARSTSYDIATRKIDPNGNTLWTKFYLGTYDDRGIAIALSPSGNVYVAGLNGTSPTDYDVVTIAYNSSGTQLWAKTYNGSANGNDEAEDITLTPGGEIVVAGITDTDPTNGINYDYLALKYSATGNLVYAQSINGTGNGSDDARVVLPVSSADVIVTGGMFVTLNNMNAATVKLDSAGQTLWTKYVDGTGDNNDVSRKILLDASGNCYVAGYTVQYNEDKNILLHHINSAGTSVFTKTITGTSGVSADDATGLTTDATGNIYLCGHVRDANQGHNYYAAKFDPTGNLLWEYKYNYLGKSDRAAAIALDAAGNVFITGKSNSIPSDSVDFDVQTIKLNNNGVLIADVRYQSGSKEDEAVDVKVSAAGNVYVAGRASVGSDENIVTIKYSNNLSQLWVKTFDRGRDDRNEAILTDAADNVYVCGRSENQQGVFDALLIKYNSAGDTVWTRLYNGAGNGEDRFNAMCFDAAGNIWLTGKTDPDSDSLNNNYDILIAKYNPNGTLLWDTAWSFSANSSETANAITFNGADKIFVAGETDKAGNHTDFVTLQINVNGKLETYATFDRAGAEDKAWGIAARANSVYVTGASTGNGTRYDATTLCYEITSSITHGLLPDNSWHIFPNPAGDFLYVTSLQTFSAHITVTDATGRVLYTGDTDGKSTCIKLPDLPQGLYFISLWYDDQLLGTKKFVVN